MKTPTVLRADYGLLWFLNENGDWSADVPRGGRLTFTGREGFPPAWEVAWMRRLMALGMFGDRADAGFRSNLTPDAKGRAA